MPIDQMILALLAGAVLCVLLLAGVLVVLIVTLARTTTNLKG
jgi:hypothetical protein